MFEIHGGEDAFINIKYMIPTYESCVLNWTQQLNDDWFELEWEQLFMTFSFLKNQSLALND